MINTWTKEQIEILCREYSTTSTEVLAKNFGRTRQHIINKARGLGLRKTPEYIESIRIISGGSRFKYG